MREACSTRRLRISPSKRAQARSCFGRLSPESSALWYTVSKMLIAIASSITLRTLSGQAKMSFSKSGQRLNEAGRDAMR